MTDRDPTLIAAADAALMRGDWRTAMAGYQAALAAHPADADAWFNLGYAAKAARAYPLALDAYAHAIARNIRGAEEAHVNRAAILSEHFGDHAAAERELKAALALAPDFVPALLNLGMLREDQGDSVLADQCYARILLQNPTHGRALLRTTMIAIHLGTADALVPKLQTLMSEPGLPLDDRADIGFALANALDALGHHPEAWRALEAANADALAATPPSLRYMPDRQEALVDALITADVSRSARPLTPEQPAPDDGSTMIFICGLFRSGSTLAEQILGRHSAITACGELDSIPHLIADHIPGYPAALNTADAGQIAQWREAVRAALPDAPSGTRYITDKRCDNFLHIGLIKLLFPDARILHTVRNPDDVLLSTLFLRFGDAVRYGARVADFAHWYQCYTRLMAHWRAHYGDDIIDVDYDALVADPQPHIAAMLARLDLPFEPVCLGHANGTATIVRTASNWQVRQPVHARSSGRAKAYARQLAGWRERASVRAP